MSTTTKQRATGRRDSLDESPQAYFARVGIKAKKHSGDEWRVDCPVCGDSEGCDVNGKTGLWSCLRASCGAKGNLWRFKSLRGDIYTIDRTRPIGERPKSRLETDLERNAPVPDSDVERWQLALRSSTQAAEARNYLHRRGFTDTVIELARLGWVQRHPNARPQSGVSASQPAGATKAPRRSNAIPKPPVVDAPVPVESDPSGFGANGLISIPYWDGEAAAHLIKFRAVPPEERDLKNRPVRFTRLKGGRTTLYLPMGPPRPDKGVLLVGGEFDALSVVQSLIAGGHAWPFDDAPFVVAGVPSGERAWNDECTAAIESVSDVVIAVDSDAAGTVAAEVLIGHIGRHRSRRGRWPGGAKDANDALKIGDLSLDLLLAVWTDAEAVGIAGIKHPTELEDEVVAHIFTKDAKGRSTGIRCLDELTGGLRGGEITVVTGGTGAGKSTICSQIAEWTALDSRGPQAPVLICPFELGAKRQLIKLIRQHEKAEPYDMTELDLRHSIRKVSVNRRLMIFDWYGPVEEARFRETLLYAIRQLGAELIVFDHLHYAIQKGDEKFFSAVASMVQMVQGVILNSNAHMLLVAQPGKTGDGKHRDDVIVQLGDIKGGAEVTQDLANAWSMYRPRSNDRSDGKQPGDTRAPEWVEAGLVALKAREKFGSEGSLELRYNTRTERFYDPRDLPGSGHSPPPPSLFDDLDGLD